MRLLTPLIRQVAAYDILVDRYGALNPLESQRLILSGLLNASAKGLIGQSYGLKGNEDYQQFTGKVPLSTYEESESWWRQILAGKNDVLRIGKPLALVRTSGTSSDAKYLPMTKTFLKTGQSSGRRVVSHFMVSRNDYAVASGMTLNLVGAAALEQKGNYQAGLLSTINTFHRPWYLQKKMLPTVATQQIADPKERFAKIVSEIQSHDVTILIGQPTWTLDFMKKASQLTGKTVAQLFPKLQLFLSGGVVLNPYRLRLKECLGEHVTCLDSYIASEGFFAFQTDECEDMLLNLFAGVYYEFLDVGTGACVDLSQIELNKAYELVISNQAGLLRYRTGDLVQLTSTYPYRLQVVGRVSQFLNLAAEKISESQAQRVIECALQKYGLKVCEWTLGPDENRLSHHWVVEGISQTICDKIGHEIDQQMQQENFVYRSARVHEAIKICQIDTVPNGTFVQAMEKLGKSGGQNKVPRVLDNRSFIVQVLS